MNRQVFTSMSSRKIASLIGRARHRIVFAAPAFRRDVGN